MDRRNFFKKGALFTAATTLLGGNVFAEDKIIGARKAKNIIFLVSDGMSSGTLSMTDYYLTRIYDKKSKWISTYQENKVNRALMETCSASSIVTDSAAASSAFGGGVKVPNGSLNVLANGEKTLPIWQKFKKKGKKAGIVTTVTATHATPAGFCVNSSSRNAEPQIAEDYLALGIDVIMGGGDEFFNPTKRKDNKDLYKNYKDKGYIVAQNLNDLNDYQSSKPILGIFSQGGLPYRLDRLNTPELKKTIPSLAQMATKAINYLNKNKDGFVLQIESGKVDWAAHANDLGALIHEQIEFDEALKVALDFAEKDGETLVIFTTDHGNANPGLIYGKECNHNFDSIANYKYTNEWILNKIDNSFSTNSVIEFIKTNLGFVITSEEAHYILGFYSKLEKEDEGLYNYKHLPYEGFAQMQKKHSSVGWISMDHSSDHVELGAYGPGQELIKPFIVNTDLHYVMLQAAHIDNRF